MKFEVLEKLQLEGSFILALLLNCLWWQGRESSTRYLTGPPPSLALMSLSDTDIAAYQSTRLCCTGSVTTLKILFFLQFCHYGDISLIIIFSNIFLHCKFLQSSEDEVNEHHSAQLVSYIKFAKYQRGQCLKSVKAAVTDTKEVRINEDTFTADEVEEIIEAVNDAVRGEVESELLNTSHTNILLLKQLFSQAEKWHLNLDTDMSELENKDLLDAVKKWEEQELSGSKVDKQFLWIHHP